MDDLPRDMSRCYLNRKRQQIEFSEIASASCPYRRCGVDTEIPYRLPFWRDFWLILQVRVDSGVDTEFPYRVRIADRGVDCRDPVCRHRFRFPEQSGLETCVRGRQLEDGMGGGRNGCFWGDPILHILWENAVFFRVWAQNRGAPKNGPFLPPPIPSPS